MKQMQNKTLYWEDEERKEAPASSEHFWRSVWKGIENRRSVRSVDPSSRELPLEPPRDYVVDAEQGLYR